MTSKVFLALRVPADPLRTFEVFTQEIHDAPAVRVRQRGESAIQVGGAHFSDLNLNPVAFSMSSTETVLLACVKVQ